MARITVADKSIEVPSGTNIGEQSKALGISMGCSAGVCGKCTVTVISGGESLSALSDKEVDMGLEANERLACQTSVTDGDVVLSQ